MVQGNRKDQVMTESLISRLEALTEPSREIDAEIALAFGWAHICDQAGFWWEAPGNSEDCHIAPPRFTDSIDAALTLVPEGWALHILHGGRKEANGTQPWAATLSINGDAQTSVDAEHVSSAAMALLIAIMKAKESNS